jgi:hypothetical protein
LKNQVRSTEGRTDILAGAWMMTPLPGMQDCKGNNANYPDFSDILATALSTWRHCILPRNGRLVWNCLLQFTQSYPCGKAYLDVNGC